MSDAMGFATVASSRGPECHAATYYTAKSVQGKRRRVLREAILTFWQAQCVAVPHCPGEDACGSADCDADTWHARDVVTDTGLFYAVAASGEQHRADRIEMSHVVSAYNSGAWCACNVVPERGAGNAARGDDDMRNPSMSARAILAAWPAYWRANLARKASLARL